LAALADFPCTKETFLLFHLVLVVLDQRSVSDEMPLQIKIIAFICITPAAKQPSTVKLSFVSFLARTEGDCERNTPKTNTEMAE
jgi:hypothetical protein